LVGLPEDISMNVAACFNTPSQPRQSYCFGPGRLALAQLGLSGLKTTFKYIDLLVLSREWMGLGEWDDYY